MAFHSQTSAATATAAELSPVLRITSAKVSRNKTKKKSADDDESMQRSKNKNPQILRGLGLITTTHTQLLATLASEGSVAGCSRDSSNGGNCNGNEWKEQRQQQQVTLVKKIKFPLKLETREEMVEWLFDY